MFNKCVRWLVWGTGGLALVGLAALHFSHIWLMPDYLIMTIGICGGMYFLMLVDTIIAEMMKNKKVKGE